MEFYIHWMDGKMSRTKCEFLHICIWILFTFKTNIEPKKKPELGIALHIQWSWGEKRNKKAKVKWIERPNIIKVQKIDEYLLLLVYVKTLQAYLDPVVFCIIFSRDHVGRYKFCHFVSNEQLFSLHVNQTNLNTMLETIFSIQCSAFKIAYPVMLSFLSWFVYSLPFISQLFFQQAFQNNNNKKIYENKPKKPEPKESTRRLKRQIYASVCCRL